MVGFAILNVCNFECCFSSSDGRFADCLVVWLFGCFVVSLFRCLVLWLLRCLVLWLLGCAGVLTLLLCFVF